MKVPKLILLFALLTLASLNSCSTFQSDRILENHMEMDIRSVNSNDDYSTNVSSINVLGIYKRWYFTSNAKVVLNQVVELEIFLDNGKKLYSSFYMGKLEVDPKTVKLYDEESTNLREWEFVEQDNLELVFYNQLDYIDISFENTHKYFNVGEMLHISSEKTEVEGEKKTIVKIEFEGNLYGYYDPEGTFSGYYEVNNGKILIVI